VIRIYLVFEQKPPNSLPFDGRCRDGGEKSYMKKKRFL